MPKEIEAKFVDVDIDHVRAKLNELGAALEFDRKMYKRQVFNLPDATSHDDVGSAWIRVRDEGDQITMTYKEIVSKDVDGVEEIETRVDDFTHACEMLLKIGCTKDVYEQNYREKWEYEGVEITIDEWPHIPPFVEIEASTEKEVRDTARRLGLEWDDALFGAVGNVYRHYFDIESIHEITSLGDLTFEQVLPEKIEAKRK